MRKSMPKCNFNKVFLRLYSNQNSAWVVSSKLAASFQNTFLQEYTTQKMKFSIKDFSSKCDQIRMENFIF